MMVSGNRHQAAATLFSMRIVRDVGWWADRWQPQRARQFVKAAAALMAMIVVCTFIQAVRGQPASPVAVRCQSRSLPHRGGPAVVVALGRSLLRPR